MNSYIFLQIGRLQKKHSFTLILVLAGLFLAANSGAYAQDKHSQQNFHPGIPYSISDIENINLTNGNLMFNFNFGNVKGRGTATTGISLKYNSKLYEFHVMTTLDVNGNNSPQRFLRRDNEGGWQYDRDYRLRIINRNDGLDQPLQTGGGCQMPTHDATYVWKLILNFPDGSQHEFRPTGYSDSAYNGSGISIYSGEGYFNVDTAGRRTDMFWTSQSSTSCPSGTIYSTSVAFSQNPNPTMTYYSTDGTFMRLEIPNGQNNRNPSKWTLYMPDGSKVTNGELDAQSNPLPQRIYDKNDNFVTKENVILPDSTTAAGYVDQFGRYVAKKAVSQTEDHIYKMGFDGEPLIWKVKWKYITVIRKYTTSGTSSGPGRCCYSTQVLTAQPKVVDEIEMPSQLGGLKYQFTYNGHDGQVDWNLDVENPNSSPGWGDLLSVTLPGEAESEYDYSAAIGFGTDEILPLLGKVREKRLIYETDYDGNNEQATDRWLYSISYSGGYTTITAPDGSLTRQDYYRVDTDNDLSGRVYKETKPDGTIVERIWKNNKVGGCPQYGCGSMRRLNTYVKTEFTTIPDSSGNPSLTAIKDFDYDKNGNITKITEYDWVSYVTLPRDSLGKVSGIPGGTVPVRIAENSYYNQTEDASISSANNPASYWNVSAPNVRSAIKSTTIKNASGTPVSRSEFEYFDVNTTANLIETKAWDSFKGGTAQAYSDPLTPTNSISTTAQYDQHGNPTLTTDAKGVQTQITHGDIVTPTGTVNGLYPTQTISAYGTSVARTSSAIYDFYTGLVTSATDEDNDVSVVTEYDALGRAVKVRTAAGTPLETWTRTEYDDVARRVIVRSDLEMVGDGKKVAVQHYDQLGRVRLSRSLENAATEDPTNETHGIKVQTRYRYDNGSDPANSNGTYTLTSNPYRAATSDAATNESTMSWKVSYENKSGNLETLETFAGAGLPSPWGTNTNSTGFSKEEEELNTSITTDESGKKRRTVTDAFGRLIRVDEPDSNGDLGSISSPIQPTNYTYDTLGNLTQIVQGGQTRTFAYSSLSRLLSATNPESGMFQYTYDTNGNLLTKTDARNVTTTHMYDTLNRVTFRNYSDSTPDITYTYDDNQVPFSKGKLTKVSSDASETSYLAYDAQDRITASRQRTDGRDYDFGYTYNLDDDLKTQTYPSLKVVEYDYDASGDLEQVGKLTGFGEIVYANSFSYSLHGQVEKVRLGNGKWETTQFNSSLQITQVGLGHSATDTGLWKANFDFGEWEGSTLNAQKNNGNLARQTIIVPTIGTATGFTAVQTYTYDKLDRVKSAVETVSGVEKWKQGFLYDRFGNRNFDTLNTTLVSSESTIPKVANPEILVANNRFKQDQDGDGQADYLYDNSGNVTKDARQRDFTYDAENRQITAVGSNLSMSYSYDGNGKRVKSHNAITNQATIFVYDAEGDLATEYTVNVPPPTSPTISYLTEDALGSPRVITNSFGEIKARRDFLPFGDEIYAGIGSRNTNQKYSSTADDVRKKFATYQRDIETGLDFAQSRYYSPMQGRFTSPDEFKGGPDELFDFEEDASDNPTFYADLTNPQSLNKYQYTYNNPYKYTDPTGHCVGVFAPICTPAGQRVVDAVRTSSIGIGIGAAVGAGIDAMRRSAASGIGDPSCPGCTSSQRMGQSLMSRSRGSSQPTRSQGQVSGQAGGSAGMGPPKPRGSRNPKTAKAAAEGRRQHREFAKKVKNKEGWKSEKTVTNPQTGKRVRPDALSRRDKPVELKPNTPSGRKRGAKDLKEQESATGKKGRVVYYEPKP